MKKNFISFSRITRTVAVAALLTIVYPPVVPSSETAIGTVTSTRGAAFIRRPGVDGSLPASMGMDFIVGDTLSTGSDGKSQIALSDKSFMNIAANTSLRINQYSFDQYANRRKAVIRVMNGKIRIVVFLPRSPESNVRVETDAASIIIGDRCDIIVEASPALTRVVVLDETVRVRNASNYVIGETKPGVNQSVTVSGRKPPSLPGQISQADRRRYLREMSK